MMVYLTRTTRPVSECARVVPSLPETGLRASRSSRRSTLEHRTHVPRVGIITRGSKFVMRRAPPRRLVIGSNFDFGVNVLHPRAFCAMLLSTKYAEGSGRMPPSPPHETRAGLCEVVVAAAVAIRYLVVFPGLCLDTAPAVSGLVLASVALERGLFLSINRLREPMAPQFSLIELLTRTLPYTRAGVNQR